MTGLFLVAHIAGRGVAIDTTQVESVVDIGAIVSVPRSPPAVRGLAALRSRVVTVLNTPAALGLPAGTPVGSRAVITQVDGHHYAVPVDTLEDVVTLEPRPLSSGLALQPGWRTAAVGLVERDGEPLLILDLAALVPGGAIGVAT